MSQYVSPIVIRQRPDKNVTEATNIHNNNIRIVGRVAFYAGFEVVGLDQDMWGVLVNTITDLRVR
jgi:hypothetical protein